MILGRSGQRSKWGATACARSTYMGVYMVTYTVMYMALYAAMGATVRVQHLAHANRGNALPRVHLDSIWVRFDHRNRNLAFRVRNLASWLRNLAFQGHTIAVTSHSTAVTSQTISRGVRTYGKFARLRTQIPMPYMCARTRTHAQEEKTAHIKVVGKYPAKPRNLATASRRRLRPVFSVTTLASRSSTSCDWPPNATTIPLRHRTRHAATRWPTARLPKWQSERQVASRPMVPSRRNLAGEARGNSRQPSQSLFSLSERQWR
jgi:hypothetical protein